MEEWAQVVENQILDEYQEKVHDLYYCTEQGQNQ